MHNLEELFLDSCLSNLLRVENFIEHSQLIWAEKQKQAATIICTEIFCNIVEHAQVPAHTKIRIGIKRQKMLEIEFAYQTKTFDKLLETVNAPRPYYKPKEKRYGGLGLVMLNNLAKNIEYKKNGQEATILVTL